jgi:hypothetical protein
MLAACGSNGSRCRPSPPPKKVLNLYIWNDYLAEDTISNFETGIRCR